jgi:hypothetical protein
MCVLQLGELLLQTSRHGVRLRKLFFLLLLSLLSLLLSLL